MLMITPSLSLVVYPSAIFEQLARNATHLALAVQRRRVWGRDSPRTGPHTLCLRLGCESGTGESVSGPSRVLTGGHEAHLLGDRHGVVADALVMPSHQRQLYRPHQGHVVGTGGIDGKNVPEQPLLELVDDGSRSAKALIATRICTAAWRPSRSTMWREVASSGSG